MTNLNEKKARLDELNDAIRAASLDIERCVTSSYRTAKYTYSGFCFVDDTGRISFYRNSSRLVAIPSTGGAFIMGFLDVDTSEKPHTCAYSKLPVDVRDTLETMANARDRLEELHAEYNALESEIEAEENEELPPPPATIVIDELAPNERQTHARPLAFMARFTGYDSSDICYHRFEVTAEIVFFFEGEERFDGHCLDIPVTVTAPDYPYQSHNLEDNIRACDVAEQLAKKDARWSRVPLFEITEAIRDALKYEELPELEARRYCFGVNRDLETFATLRELGESEWERLQELDADEWREEPAEEAIEEPNAAEIDLLAMARDFIDDNRRLCDVSFDDFHDYLTEKIDAYFLTFDVAETGNEYTEPCVKAVVTCGGPYCDIRSFFGDYPEVYYRSGSSSRANIELSPVARGFFDTLVEWRTC